jgi:predicted aconitase with swiveling domain
MAGVMRGTPLVSGAAVGEALVSREPLSFWGGYDHHTGEIIDRRHPLAGQNAAGKVLILPYARGSDDDRRPARSPRAGTAPAAILTTAAETFFALAAIVAGELYQRSIPVVILDEHDAANLRSGMRLRVDADGTIAIETDRSS